MSLCLTNYTLPRLNLLHSSKLHNFGILIEINQLLNHTIGKIKADHQLALTAIEEKLRWDMMVENLKLILSGLMSSYITWSNFATKMLRELRESTV
jgi:hypothetical protein